MDGQNLTDEQVLAAIARDDAYQVVRVLTQKGIAATELVRLPGEPLRIRKRIPIELANERAWTALIDIRDPHLPRVREVYRLPDQLVVVCDYVEGMPLGELVNAVGHLEPGEAVHRLRELCHAAGVLHAHGIVHRDIAPGNVVISATGTHLIDLGNARTHDAAARRDTTLLGTYGFASPEQYGFAQTDARSDIYSLGRLLAYMLTGVLPSDTDFDVAYLDDRLVMPALRTVIDRACAFEPSARYQSADELASASLAALDAARAPQQPRVVEEAEPDQPVQPVQPPLPQSQPQPHSQQPPAPQPVPAAHGSHDQGPSRDAAGAPLAKPHMIPTLADVLGIPVMLSRFWPHADRGQKLGTVFVTISALFWVMMFIAAGFLGAKKAESNAATGVPLFGIAIAYAVVALGGELCRCILRADDYATHPRGQLLGRRFVGCLIIFAVGFAVSIVAAVILGGAR